MSKKHRAVVLSIILTTVSLSMVASFPKETSAYTPYDPIYINGNENFTVSNGVNGGSGTSSDPYIIEGWEIDASVSTGIVIANTDAHFIIRNVFVHSGSTSNMNGINFSRVRNGHVDNATLSDNEHGILTYESSNLTFTGNTITKNDRHAISLRWGTNIVIAGNSVSDNDGSIALSYFDNLTVQGNIISGNRGGLSLWDSSDITITGNDIYSNRVTGILLMDSSNATLTENSISDNWNGIDVQSSADIFISANSISGSRYNSYSSGICILDSSSNVKIHANNVSNNSNGIVVRSSTNILVYHNNITNNNNQSYDDGSNSWDNGYPSGGNYWGDYGCFDMKKGPNQDQPDSDGICDTPLEIPGGQSMDRYPFFLQLPQKEDESVSEQAWFWVAVAVAIIVLLFVLFILIKRRKSIGR